MGDAGLFYRELDTTMCSKELPNLITQPLCIAFGGPRDEYAPVVGVTCETSVGLSFSGDVSCCFTVVALVVQEPVQLVQDYVGEQRRRHAAVNLAKRGLMFDIVVPRSRLKPCYGQGSTFRQDSTDKEVT